jgi:hypothetical protein
MCEGTKSSRSPDWLALNGRTCPLADNPTSTATGGSPAEPLSIHVSFSAV